MIFIFFRNSGSDDDFQIWWMGWMGCSIDWLDVMSSLDILHTNGAFYWTLLTNMLIRTKHQDQGIFWNVFFFMQPWMKILHHYSNELTLVHVKYAHKNQTPRPRDFLECVFLYAAMNENTASLFQWVDFSSCWHMLIRTKHQGQGIFWNMFFFMQPWMKILHHYSNELTLVQILYTNLYIVPFAMLFI